jgi:hypothetical protein
LDSSAVLPGKISSFSIFLTKIFRYDIPNSRPYKEIPSTCIYIHSDPNGSPAPAAALAVLALLFATISCSPDIDGEDRAAAAPAGLQLGMDEAAFTHLYPSARNDGPGRYVRTAREFGINGQWIYSFHGGRLNWYIFNAQETEVSEENFDRTFEAASAIIETYIGLYGAPWREDRGFSEFINPEESSHHGYKVREAQWRIPEGRVVVDFSFLGEGGVYSLLLTIQATS